MKKYIYEVYIEQYYNVYGVIFRNKLKFTDSKELWNTLILATDEKEAISIFDDRYEWEDLELSRFTENKYFPNKCSLVENVLRTEKRNCCISELKRELYADEFLEYCKQELYPIEVIMK